MRPLTSAAPMLATLALLALAPAAAGHGVVRKTGGVLSYEAADPGIGAELEISSPRRGIVRFADRRSPNGIAWGPCFPVSQRIADCRSKSVTRIEVELFDGDDIVIASVATALVIDAGAGDDRVEGGYGRDVVDGGDGNDVLSGGEGSDSVLGDAGTDRIDVRDGANDPFSCGGGLDTAFADPQDPSPFLLECESLEVAPAAADETAPKPKVAKRPIALGRRLAIEASLSEPGTLAIGGKLSTGERAIGPIGSVKAKPDAPDQVWTLKPRVSGKVRARAERALARGRAVDVSLKLRTRDGAGNAQTRHVKRALRV